VTREGRRGRRPSTQIRSQGLSGDCGELVSLFAINTYVNSGGARYLPRMAAETVLVETFPETDDPPTDSPLLKALGLARRKAVSRVEIESALEDRGLTVIEQELGLDPRVYKLVCIRATSTSWSGVNAIGQE